MTVQETAIGILGLKKGFSPVEAKKTYRTMALECHPDKNPGDAKAEAKFKRISWAYQILTDPEFAETEQRKKDEDGTGASSGVPSHEDPLDNLFDLFAGLGGDRVYVHHALHGGRGRGGRGRGGRGRGGRGRGGRGGRGPGSVGAPGSVPCKFGKNCTRVDCPWCKADKSRKASPSRFCPSCGTRTVQGAKFCTSCGSQV